MRNLTTALVGAAILALSFSAAEARPRQHHHHHRGTERMSHAFRHHHQVVQYRRVRFERVPARQFEQVQEQQFSGGFEHGFQTGSGLVHRARQFIGDTAREVGVRSRLWCSAFLRKITGAQDVDDTALSWERHRRIAPQVGAVVTMSRRGGGHVGLVSGFDKNGDPIVISGNHGGRVAESIYPRNRIRAWVSAS